MPYIMARRNTSNKIEPAVMTLPLQTQTLPAATQPGGAGTSILPSVTNLYCDLSQVASLMNRRFYRQGINWATAGMKLVSSPTIPTGSTSVDAYVTVSKLPNTWVMSNAWEKSFRAWQRANREAMEEAESVRPRFLDFKIYADSGHHTAGYAANWLPPLYTAGEWEASEIYTPNGPNFPGNTTNFELVAVGSNFPGAGASGLDAVSIIEGYAASRGLPNIQDPNTPDDALDADGSTPENWLSAMFNDGTDRDSEVLEDLITKNNLAPYPFENDGVHTDTMYPGGANQAPYLEIHDQHPITSSTLGGTTRLKGGNFPCGLIKIQLFNYSLFTVDAGLLIDMVPGTHRGYLCEPMTEM